VHGFDDLAFCRPDIGPETLHCFQFVLALSRLTCLFSLGTSLLKTRFEVLARLVSRQEIGSGTGDEGDSDGRQRCDDRWRKPAVAGRSGRR
jgi:hypothetical protein